MREILNFDANACSSLLPEVREFLANIPEVFLNPSSIHQGGQKARAILEEARESILRSFGASPKEYRVIFTSGATEADNLALRGVLNEGDHLVTSSTEHVAVLEALQSLKGVENSVLPPDSVTGEINSEEVIASIKENTRIISFMGANNETGVLTDIPSLVKKVREHTSFRKDLIIHSDIVQLPGKEEVAVGEWGLDLATISGHKMGAPTGVGALIARKNISFKPILFGGPQELFTRAGTENLLGIASLAIAAKAVTANLSSRKKFMKEKRDFIKHEILRECSPVSLTVDTVNLLPNTLNIHLPGIRADDLIVALDRKGILISSGSACASGKPNPSHVILALGRSSIAARETVRISLESYYTDSEIDYFLKEFISAVKTMRQSLEGK